MPANQPVCQSCGMPLGDASLHGTNADGSPNREYCVYCCKDGAFTSDVDLEGMIAQCVPHLIASDPGMTLEKAQSMMRAFLPQLKRWAK